MTKPARLSASMISTSLSSIAFTLLTFASGVVLARCLGEEGRGQYGSAYFWGQFVISLGSLSVFEAAIVQRKPDTPPERCLPSLMLSAAAVSVLSLAVFAAAVELGLVKAQGVQPAVLLLFVAACVVQSQLSRAMFTVENMRHNFGLLNIERIFNPFMFVLFSFGAALLFGGTLNSIMIAFVASTLPLFFVRLYRFRHALRLPVDGRFTRSAFRLGAKFHTASALTLIAAQLDKLVLVSAWPPDRLGYYFVAVSAAGAGLSIVSQALGLTLLPILSAVSPSVRRERVERLFRYTLLATAGFVALAWLAAPFAVPLFYGQGFAPTVFYTQGLALALAPQPLRAIVLEANRSAQRNRPGLEMAVASLLVFLAIFAITRLAEPTDLFWAIGLSNLAAIAVGLRHPVAAGDIRLGACFALGRADVAYLTAQIVGYAREGALRWGRR